MLESVIRALHNIPVELTEEDIADILWLATYVDPFSSNGKEFPQKQKEVDNQEKAIPPLDRSDTGSAPGPSPAEQAKTDLHHQARQKREVGHSYASALAFLSPAVTALPGALALGRALRPLMRKIPSSTAFVLDEEKTAHHIAEQMLSHQQIFFPILQAIPVRWFDIALVVDESRSMQIWRPTIYEWKRLLERHGAFRNVQAWSLAKDEQGRPRLHTGWPRTPQSRICHPDELVDPGKRRILLVVSDCISEIWYNGKAPALLEKWGRKSLVTLVQVLPERLWSRCALGTATAVQMRAQSIGAVNSKFDHKSVEYSLIEEGPKRGIPFPVVPLEAEAVAEWVEAIIMAGSTRTPGYIFALQEDIDIVEEYERENDEASAQKLLERFTLSASPLARQLLAFLAAAPISLPVIRLIQHTKLPASNLSHVAEILGSGLLEQVPSQKYTYDFKKGIREALLDILPQYISIQVMLEVSKFISQKVGAGHTLDFHALLKDPTSAENLVIEEASYPFASVAAQVLYRLGGNYQALAKKLEQMLGTETESVTLGSQYLQTHSTQEQQENKKNRIEENAGLIKQSTAYTDTRLPRTPIIWNMPFPRNPFFVGNDALLRELHRTLTAHHDVALIQQVALTGIGGIGKTQVALEYAYRYRGYYSAVLWINAAGQLSSEITKLVRLLALPEEQAYDQYAGIRAVIHWLHTHENWLLILDDLQEENLGEVAVLLSDIGVGHVLFTTRIQTLEHVAIIFDLGELSEDEGALLLLRRAKRLAPDEPLRAADQADRAAVTELVALMGGLPLALEQAGAYIDETGCSISEYLQLFQKYYKNLPKQSNTDDYPASVIAAILHPYNIAYQQQPAARDLLRFCSLLHPDGVPEELFRVEGVDLGPALTHLARDLPQWNELLHTLQRHSLITWNLENRLLIVHHLVRSLLLDEMDKALWQEWSIRVVLAVNKSSPNVEATTWHLYERYLPHALVCAEYIERWEIRRPEAANLLNSAGDYLYQRGHYTEAEPLYRQALAIRERALGPNHPETAISLSNLAALYSQQNKFELVEPLLLRTLTIRDRTLGRNHPITASTVRNLADLYYQQDKYDLAKPLYQQAYQTFTNLNDRSALNHIRQQLSLIGRAEEQQIAVSKRILPSRWSSPIEVFYSYTAVDTVLVSRLEKSLKPLEHSGNIKSWHSGMIRAGQDWQQEIARHLDSAQLILLFVSPDFIASDACYEEMLYALERQHRGEARVVPILLRPCSYKNTPLASLQMLPRNGKPIISWPSRDGAFEILTDEIRKVVEELAKNPGDLLSTDKALETKTAIQTRLCDVLLVTITRPEFQAALKVSGISVAQLKRQYIENNTYYDLGNIGGARVFLARSEMGTLMTIANGIHALRPSAVIMCGTAFGLHRDKQQIGDILISRQLMSYELQRVMERGGKGRLELHPRGDRFLSSPRLLDRFRDGEIDWQGASLHFGLILSGEKLVDAADFHDALLRLEPEAIGGEMEGAGLYAAAQSNHVDWILVKGICDWADSKKEQSTPGQVSEQERQQIAAENAARFVFHVLNRGGFAIPPGSEPEQENEGRADL